MPNLNSQICELMSGELNMDKLDKVVANCLRNCAALSTESELQ